MKYNLNEYKTVASLMSFMTDINEAIENRMKTLKLCEKADEVSKKSFGYIKESFENLSPILFESKEGRKFLAQYGVLFNKNKSLREMHTIYENVRKMGKNSDIDFFVNSLSTANFNVDNNKLKEGTEALGKLLAEAYIFVGEEAENLMARENIALDNAISYIVENKKSNKNLSNYSAAIKIIREDINTREQGTTIFENKDIDSVAEKLLKEYNEKYSVQLTEDEKIIIKEVSESKNPEDAFNKYKNACVQKIEEAKVKYEKSGDKISADKMNAIFEQVSKKVYTSDTMAEDICNLIEIAKIFD